MHAVTQPCRSEFTREAVARQQGLGSESEERTAGPTVFHGAVANDPEVFTTISIQYIFKRAHQVDWLMEDGCVEVDPDAASTAATAAESAAAAAPSQSLGMADGVNEHLR